MITNNNFHTSNISTSDEAVSKLFLNYINYELSLFEKNTNKKFIFILSNDRFELNVCERKEEDNNNKSNYQVVFRANNVHQFIKRLFMIRAHLNKYLSIGITTTSSVETKVLKK